MRNFIPYDYFKAKYKAAGEFSPAALFKDG